MYTGPLPPGQLPLRSDESANGCSTRSASESPRPYDHLSSLELSPSGAAWPLQDLYMFDRDAGSSIHDPAPYIPSDRISQVDRDNHNASEVSWGDSQAELQSNGSRQVSGSQTSDGPQPTPKKSSAGLNHVDVDLGPIKAVSRTHAIIEYRPDFGLFCVEICGRNGAWIDDRYFLQGSIVPLYQGYAQTHIALVPKRILKSYRSQIQIATRIFSFILPPSPTPSPSFSSYAFEGSLDTYDTYKTLDSVPYPWNLPPAKVGFDEFYEEGRYGSASASTSAPWVPQPFSAFAADDGYGLGLQCNGEDEDSDDWSSEDQSDDECRDESDDEGADDGSEGNSLSTASNEESPLSSLSDEEESEDEQWESEDLRGEKKLKKGTPQNGRGQPADATVLKTRATLVEDPLKRSGNKAFSKSNVKTIVKPKNGKGREIIRGSVDRDRSKTSFRHDTQANSDDAAGEGSTMNKGKLVVRTKGSKNVAKVSTASAKSKAAAATLAAAIDAPPIAASLLLSLSLSSTQAQPSVGKSLLARSAKPPPSNPSLAAGLSSTRPAAKLPVQVTRPGRTPDVAASQLLTDRRSTSPPSPTGSVDPQKPFFLTELIETPGRPGHIIVNVPVPPSGAPPRSPPKLVLGLDGLPFIGPSAIRPKSTFGSIIYLALLALPRGRGSIGEVCNWVAGEWEWFRHNVDTGWPKAIRHNLSLNKTFLKVSRIAEDAPGFKGAVWIIDPSMVPAFEEKQRRDADKTRPEAKVKKVDQSRERERPKYDDRIRPIDPGLPVPSKQPIPHAVAAPGRAVIRPAVVPPSPATQTLSANAKGILQSKAKVVIFIRHITAAMRSKSVISNSDASGNPLPFVCDGPTLVLDQQAFGHLNNTIIEKLAVLGAADAIDVLLAWVANKNQQRIVKAAQISGRSAPPSTNPTVPTSAIVTTPKPDIATRPANGSPAIPFRPHQAANRAAPVRQTITTTATSAPSLATRPTPIVAPLGASLTKVISLIAEVAQTKRDINTVGPNASALLRYIRVVGAEIDLRVAEQIWATGVVPPLASWPSGKIKRVTTTPTNEMKRKPEPERVDAEHASSSSVEAANVTREVKKPKL